MPLVLQVFGHKSVSQSNTGVFQQLLDESLTGDSLTPLSATMRLTFVVSTEISHPSLDGFGHVIWCSH